MLGLLLARLFGGGASESKALDELRTEFDEYRDGVSKHFDTTSELFQDMTEKYRDVYNHMAGGATTFGGASDSPPRLEIVSDVEQIETVVEEAPATNDDASEPTIEAEQEASLAGETETDEDAELRRKANSPALEQPVD
ncbi:MAG: YhcB family protein [Gammaproteobacteria bacterium]